MDYARWTVLSTLRFFFIIIYLFLFLGFWSLQLPELFRAMLQHCFAVSPEMFCGHPQPILKGSVRWKIAYKKKKAMYCIYCTLIEAIQGGRSVTHSLSVDSRPTKCSVCCGSKQEAGLFQASALFKGDFIFNVDMYLDFTAKFDVQQPHPSSPPSVAATWWGWPFSPWCGTVPAFPSAYSLRSKGVNWRPAPSPNLPWRSTVTCFLFCFVFTGMVLWKCIPKVFCFQTVGKELPLQPKSSLSSSIGLTSVGINQLPCLPDSFQLWRALLCQAAIKYSMLI